MSSMFPPGRIVRLTEETVETLYLLGDQGHIVRTSGYVVRSPQARREKPRVGAFTSANIDKIVALKPDLVLAFSDFKPAPPPISAVAGLTFMPSTSEASRGSTR